MSQMANNKLLICSPLLSSFWTLSKLERWQFLFQNSDLMPSAPEVELAVQFWLLG
jgi:hypothetical protein